MKTINKNLPVSCSDLTDWKSYQLAGLYGVLQMKKCTRCKKAKSFLEFNKNKTKHDGVSTECKACTKIYLAKYYLDNADKVREVKKIYRSKNLESINELQKKWARGDVGKKSIRATSRKRLRSFPRQKMAIVAVGKAIKNGDIKRPDKCSACGVKGKTEAHHNDYLKPLIVIFMCVRCHNIWHKNNTALNKG